MFGGEDLDELYITSASFEWKTGYAPRDPDYMLPKGGEVCRIKTDFQGKAEFSAGF